MLRFRFVSSALAALFCAAHASAAQPELLHVVTYGQSVSVGAMATPAISTVPQSTDLMFIGGVRPQDGGSDPELDMGALVPLAEADHMDETGTVMLGETPTAGTLEMVRALRLSENGEGADSADWQYLGSAPGLGGQTIAQLSYGSAPFTRLVQSIYFGNLHAAEMGRHYRLSAVTWAQGENDYAAGTPASTYAAAMEKLRASIQNWAQYVTGEAATIPLISAQVSTHGAANTAPRIALAQTQAAATYPNIYIAAPAYMLDYADIVHLTAESSKWLGAYFGLAYKRVVVDGEAWQPLQPQAATLSGTRIKVTFHVPQPPLVFDTEQVSDPGQYGFTLVDAKGRNIPLTSAAITAPDTVTFTTAKRPPAGVRLRYAYEGGVQSGRLTGPRGNLRDSQGDTIVFEPEGLDKRMDNWCVIFDIPVR